MVAWTDAMLRARHLSQDVSILDLGTGNGLFPIKLAALEYSNLTGCDYSAASIRLAQTVAERSGASGIEWVQDDLLETGIQQR